MYSVLYGIDVQNNYNKLHYHRYLSRMRLMEHHIEYLEQQEVLIVAESPIGFRRWMIEYGLEPTNIPHELGGAPSYRLSKSLYYETKPRLVVGDRPVPKELLDVAMREIIVADEETINVQICGVKGR